jgi:hypothetical protein
VYICKTIIILTVHLVLLIYTFKDEELLMDNDEAVGNNLTNHEDEEELVPTQRRFMNETAIAPLMEIRESEGIRKKLAFSVNELMSSVAVFNGEDKK